MRPPHERLAALSRGHVDALVAVAIIFELQLQCWLNQGIPAEHRLVTAVASVLFAAPIAVRRTSPSFALLFCVSVAAIQNLLHGNLQSGPFSPTPGYVVPVLVMLLLGYSAGAWLDTRGAVITVILGVGLIVSCAFLPPGDGTPATGGNVASAILYSSLEIIPAWFVGRLARERTRRTTLFRALAAQAAAEQDEREAAAIAQERARIGGELQDIIAHSISAMVIQAGGARLLLRSDPDRARDSILTVEQTGRQALGDLRRLLGMLRKDDDPRALSPQPGLSQLPALLDSVRQTCAACELRILGEPIDLSPGVNLVAYRVIEAALLSAGDHGGGDRMVTIRYEPHELRLEIRGDGTIPKLGESLRAITQRVELYDGSIDTASSDGSFTVHARLPLEAAVRA